MKILTTHRVIYTLLLLEAMLAPMLVHFMHPASLVIFAIITLLAYFELRFGLPMDAAVKVLEDIAMLHTKVEQSTIDKHEAESELRREKINSEQAYQELQKLYQHRLNLEALSKGLSLPRSTP